MSDKNELNLKQGIYISLDALLDTRLATLYLMGEEVMIGALANGYFLREEDSFHNVSKEVFAKAYKERNVETIKNAGATKIIGFINEIIVELNKQAVLTPLHTGPKIYLNTYPYVLNEGDVEMIVAGLAAATGKLCDIQAIHLSEAQLTPLYCKQNFAIMFMYDYSSWFDTQAENFRSLPCPEITLIVPGIYFTRIPTEDELREAINNAMHPMKMIEFISSVFIKLTLHDVDLFCVKIKLNK